MPCSAQDTFAWTGAILINIGFIFGIFWGTFTTWYVGAGLTAVYSALLFCCARGLEKRQTRPLQETGESSGGASQDGSVSSSNGGGTTLLISLLYGLAILAMGVTGFFIPINVIGNCRVGASSSVPFQSDAGRWVTPNTTTFSPSVQEWIEESKQYSYYIGGSSFVHLPLINTTLFRGSLTDNEILNDMLFVSSSSGAPEEMRGYKEPDNMVAVTDSVGCFRYFQNSSFYYDRFFGCYINGTIQDLTAEEVNDVIEVRVFDDDDEEGVVWYRGFSENARGDIFVSVNVNTPNTTTVHSVLKESDDAADDDSLRYESPCSAPLRRLQAALLLFASALPVVVVSVLLWRAKGISSAGFTSFLGVLVSYSILLTVIQPSSFFFDSNAHAIGWTILGAIYLIVFLLAAVFKKSTPPLVWGATTAAASYLTGLIFLLFVLRPDISVISWIIFLICGSIPLSLLGLVSDSWLIVLMGAGVAFASSIRLCIALGDAVGGSNNTFLVVFLSLGVTGLLVGGTGFFLGKFKSSIKQGFVSLLSPLESKVDALFRRNSPVNAPKGVTAANNSGDDAAMLETDDDFKDLEDVEF